MFCAELMSNMKDVPSTERMVMCSQRWKLLKQGEKDAYQKRCEQVRAPSTHPDGNTGVSPSTLTCVFFPQRKKEYEIEMNRFLSVSICSVLNQISNYDCITAAVTYHFS